PLAATSHQWINAISTSGVPSSTQPAFSDLSGTAAATQIPLGSVNAQTASYTAVSGDSGKLITMNCSSCTLTLPSAAPNANWQIRVMNLNSTGLAVARNGLTINGGTSNLSLTQFSNARVYTDGSNYFATPSLAIGNGLTQTAAAGANTVAVNGSGNGTKVATTTGTLTSGNYASWDASGNAKDSGAFAGPYTIPWLTALRGGGSSTFSTTTNVVKLWGVILTFPVTTTQVTYNITTAD